MPNKDTSWGGAGRLLPDTADGLPSGIRNDSTGVRRAAFEEFCRRYWKPIYAYIRAGWARGNDDAKDLTQAFFVCLLEDEALRGYAPDRGGFRPFLKSLLRHFIADRDKYEQRLKRGGGVTVVELDGLEALAPDPRIQDPGKAFDRAWRRALLNRVLERVREREAFRFRVYEAYDLCDAPERPTYAQLAARLGLKEGDVLHLLASVREEIRTEIRAELAASTDGPDALEEEWNAFLES